jgi:hypothetical protein
MKLGEWFDYGTEKHSGVIEMETAIAMRRGFILGGNFVIDRILQAYPDYDIKDIDWDDAYSLVCQVKEILLELKDTSQQ